MPCRSDYLDPNHREREFQRAAGLLVFVLESLGQPVPHQVADAANDRYCRFDVIPDLCWFIRTMTEEQRNEIVWNGRNKTSRDLAEWWEEHQEADRKREEEEKLRKEQDQAKKIKILRELGLNKEQIELVEKLKK